MLGSLSDENVWITPLCRMIENFIKSIGAGKEEIFTFSLAHSAVLLSHTHCDERKNQNVFT